MAVLPCKLIIGSMMMDVIILICFIRYLEPWHVDVFDFLDLRKNHGKEEVRARDLFLGLWVSDLFMKRMLIDFMISV